LLTFNTTFANPIIPVPTRPQIIVTPQAPTLDAKSYILVDANTGKILVEKDADQRVAPASLTKLMSMYIISAALKNGTIHLDDKVRVSEKAWRTGGSRMFIKVNTEVPVKDLIKGIVIASGNDATVAMAEYVAGSEDAFASMMNNTAKDLGMANSHFMDSNGLPSADHYSTAHDLAILARAIINNYPEDYKLYSEKYVVYNNIRQPNRNRLLWLFPTADGLKTGHTDDAGYCLVSSASKDGTRLIGVILGERSDKARTEDSIRLLTYGFRFFETHKYGDANKKMMAMRVWKGQETETALGVKSDFYATIPAGQFKNVQVSLVEDKPPHNAPITKGESYGTLKLTLNGQVLATEPLVALEDNKKGGMFRSMTDSFSYYFHKWFSKPVSEPVNNA